MPELPEVETVRKALKELVLGKVIESVEVRCSKMIKNMDESLYCQKLEKQKIVDVRRLGKYLFIDTDDYTMISHLRMEGKYNFYEDFVEIGKHDYIIFNFNDGTSLRYNDTRKFGTMELVDKFAENTLKSVEKLGLEPYDENLTVAYFKDKCAARKTSIKQILLDQTIITGFGNIYVDELLFKAKIHPLTPVNELSDQQIMAILDAGKVVINAAIKAGGTTVKSFTVSKNVTGKFQYSLNVYGRKDEECYVCNTKIKKIKVGGRGTHYCPTCQGER